MRKRTRASTNTMFTSRLSALICLVSFVAIDSVFSFVPPVQTRTRGIRERHVSWRHNNRLAPSRMANEGEAMDAAVAKANELAERAAALRQEAAAAAAEIGNKVESVKQEIEESAPPIPAVEELVPKPEISDNMKTRLRKELESQGANPNKSAGNPILVVAAIVGILVIVGGQGIFY